MGSELGVSEEKLLAIPEYAASTLFDEREKIALEFADSMTVTGREVSDEFFVRLQTHFSDDAIIELTAIIAWENASSKFNRALRIPSQGLWRPASHK